MNNDKGAYDLETPESILPHVSKYRDDAWKEYSPDELGHWVHLLTKRALMRDSREKARKDISDAQNYLDMLQAHVSAAKTQIG